jgi:hypothetical protein
MYIQQFYALCQQTSSIQEANDYFSRTLDEFESNSKLEGAIAERLLQAYLYENIHQFFPDCQELLLCEKTDRDLKKRSTVTYKCDLVFKTSYGLRIIETKFLTNKKGKSSRASRRKKRKKVLDQSSSLKKSLARDFYIPYASIKTSAFVAEDDVCESKYSAALETSVEVQKINLSQLFKWCSEKRPEMILEKLMDSYKQSYKESYYESFSCEACSHVDICTNTGFCMLFDL